MTIPPRQAARQVRRRPLIIAIVAVIVAVIILGSLSSVYTELLWFRETGFTKVFWAGIWIRAGLGAVFGAAFAVFLLINLWIVQKITKPSRLFTVPDQVLERYRQTLRPYTKWVVAGAAVLFGLFAGSGASVQWREWLLFKNAETFGQTDPVFGHDLGFYVFRLPFHRFLYTWGFSTLVVITIVSAFAHYFMGGIRPQASGERVAPEVRAHLSVLLGLIVLLKAWGYRLDQFDLLHSGRGTVTGASYTDVKAQLPALRLLVVIALVCAVFFFVNARYRNWILPLGGIGLLVLTSIVAGGIWPATVQRFQVTPNEQLRETPYIERNIAATREAFQIEDVQRRSLSGLEPLKQREVQRNRQTIENIRLWDPGVLQQAFIQRQRIKQYYEFLDADVDRYGVGNQRRQVMLSAREVSPADLDPNAQTWLNLHLVYTHGYGVVASRVDRVTEDGQPSFIVSNIPPVSTAGAPKVTQPRIYFGESEEVQFAVVNTLQDELDFPQGDTATTTRYSGRGGVRLSGLLRRAAFAWRFRDANLLISGAITPQSKILFRRQVHDRVQHVAPFLTLDRDPYVAVVGGRIVWIIDGYTTTDMYPYSQRVDLAAVTEGWIHGRANYIRNAVKFVVDAEHGTIDGYVWDEKDPVIRTWLRAFPDIFRPRSEMPDGVLQHVRYPEGLFRVQTNRYATYHIDSAAGFYQKEDAWEVADDPTQPQTPKIPAYYMLMKLPEEKELSFVLGRPFTPNGRQNMSAFMVAHGDPENYGRLVSYAFPTSDAIFGPEQVQSRINGDPEVSRQISLWNQQNSEVIYGNVMTVPIEDSLLYVQPLYLRGEGSQLPELKRVVAMVGTNIKMGNTLRGALAAIFGEAPPALVEGEEPPEAATLADLIQEARDAFRRGQDALREGDFAAYGREQDRMRRALDSAAELSGAEPSPAPS